MQLEKNMYVRTKHCGLFKILDIIEENGSTKLLKKPGVVVEVENKKYKCYLEEEILKASHTLLGNDEEPCLIEPGDYVNGKEVIKVSTDYIFDYTEEIKIIYFSEEDYIYSSADIKSIVTKEQFEQMQYKVGE